MYVYVCVFFSWIHFSESCRLHCIYYYHHYYYYPHFIRVVFVFFCFVTDIVPYTHSLFVYLMINSFYTFTQTYTHTYIQKWEYFDSSLINQQWKKSLAALRIYPRRIFFNETKFSENKSVRNQCTFDI